MTSLEKHVWKILHEQNRVTLDDILKVIDAFGYKPQKKGGSEYTFHKPGKPPLNVPTVKGRKVKLRYIKRLVDILELEEWYENLKRE